MKSVLTVFALILAFSVSAQSTEGSFHSDKEYKVSPAGTIRLSCSDAKIYITGSDRKTARVKIDREVETKGLTFGHDEFSVEIFEEEGDLLIREHSNSVSVGIIGYQYEKYTINIEAPEGTSLVLKGDDGDIWIKRINGSISLELDDADVELSQCAGNKFRFQIDDGDIKMDRGQGSLEIDADDADIEIKSADFTDVDARVDDGDLVIETSLADNGRYMIDAQDGLVSFSVSKGGGKFNIRHDDGRISSDGNFKTIRDSENRTELTYGNGSASIDIRSDDARVRLIGK